MLRRPVARAELFVLAGPLLGNLHKFRVARHLIAINLHLDPQAAVAEIHALLFPGERMVGTRGVLLGRRLDKLQVAQVALHHLVQELLRDGASGGWIEVGAGCGFGDLVPEAHHLARRRHVHAEFLLLLRPEPAVGPSPEPQRATRQGVHALQALRALQIDFGLVVIIENCRVPVTLHVNAAFGEELRGDGQGTIPIHPKLDGRLGERSPEILDAYRQ